MANTRFSTSIDIDGKRVEINIPYGSSAWQRANCIFNPLGPAPTKGWFVMTKGALSELDLNEAHTIYWNQYLTDVDSGAITSTTNLVFQGMYIVSSERVLQGGVGDANALHLVEFADVRYILSRKSDTSQLVSNLRSYANNSDYLTGTTTYGTWENLVSALWSACGLLGSYPGLPATLPIDGVPQNHWFIGLNAYRALCVVLDQLDCALRHDPFANQYTIVQLGEDQTINDNNSTLKWNSEPQNSNVASQAETLTIYFHNYLKGYGQERDAELADNWAYNGHSNSISVSTGITGAIGTVPLWDDLPRIYNELGTLTNSTELTDRANNRNTRYVSRHTITYQHRIHRGITSDFLPGGSIRACLWRNWNDGLSMDGTVNPFGGTCTEFTCTNHLVHDFRVSGKEEPAWFDKLLDTPEWFQYSAADLAKHSYPNYPRLSNVVQIYHDGVGVGQSVSPTSTYGLHKGRVRRWVNNQMDILDDCWILFIDDYDTKLGQYQALQGAFYGPARLSGITTDTNDSGTFTLPVYLCHKGGTTQGQGEIVVFTLSTALVEGTVLIPSTATAYLCALQNTGKWTPDVDQVITVTNGFGVSGRIWTAPAGAQGLAYQRLDGLYEIIFMARVDMFLPFIVSQGAYGTSHGGSFMAELDLGLPFQQGDIPGLDSNGQARVYDEGLVFPRIVAGAIGLAVWNDSHTTGPRYECVFVQQVCITAKAKVDQAQDGIQAGNPTDININSFVPTSPSPFNLSPDPLPQTAFNKFELRGKDDDQLWLEWDDNTSEWVIVQISNREKSYVGKALLDIDKGNDGSVTVYVNGLPTGNILTCKALGAKVFAGKWVSMWTDPSSGVIYVAPWECPNA